jgi:hypothetical protein
LVIRNFLQKLHSQDQDFYGSVDGYGGGEILYGNPLPRRGHGQRMAPVQAQEVFLRDIGNTLPNPMIAMRALQMLNIPYGNYFIGRFRPGGR